MGQEQTALGLYRRMAANVLDQESGSVCSSLCAKLQFPLCRVGLFTSILVCPPHPSLVKLKYEEVGACNANCKGLCKRRRLKGEKGTSPHRDKSQRVHGQPL